MELSKLKIEQVAPVSAPILHIVAFPVHERDSAPSPKYSIMLPVPPFTVSSPDILRIISFALDHPLSLPVSFMPISFGNFSSQPIPASTSTASAPPTPIATSPRPPAFDVC